MNKNKQILYITIFIILNLILWPFIILPNAVRFAVSVIKNVKNTGGAIVIENSDTAREVLERIDFYRLRDPFISRIKAPEKIINTPKKIEKTAPVVEKTSVTNASTEEKYESRFKLKSIVLLKDKYAAALEETPHYGNQADNSPYSYRFGDNYEQPVQGPKSYLVIEGDTVLGEQVVKITADSVLLQKGKKYFKLTFSGGIPVEQ